MILLGSSKDFVERVALLVDMDAKFAASIRNRYGFWSRPVVLLVADGPDDGGVVETCLCKRSVEV